MAKHRNTKPPPPVPSPSEVELFRAAVRNVKPLTHPVAARPPSRVRRAAPQTRVTAAAIDVDMPLIAADGLDGAAELAFQRAGVRTQVMRRLRRGLIPLEDELDLHGLHQSAARERLAAFLAAARSAGIRCVRIIHGKGYRSGARGPVLKIAVDLWLRRHIDVMAFTSARPIDGGTGAVYVLLRA